MKSIVASEALNETRRLLQGAQESVYARCNAHIPFIYGQPKLPLLRVILEEVPPRVSLHVVVGVIESEGAFLPSLLKKTLKTSEIARAIRAGALRIGWEWSGCHGLIVDGREALIARGDGFLFPEELTLLSGSSEVSEYVELFSNHWRYTPQGTLVEPLWKHPDTSFALLHSVSEERWSDVIAVLARKPAELYNLPPQRFEELVAELLEREGMQIQLTPRTTDGGRDILAWHSTPLGKFLYLVECKRYAPERPVGVGLVRQLYGVVEAEGANGGILITTSRFTRAAWGFGGECGARLKLSDYRVLVEWLHKAGDV